MGRRRTVNRDLPARLYLKRDGYYYRDLNRRETKIAPADDLPKALIEWAQREGVRLNPDAVTFAAVAGKFREQYVPTKAAKTRRDYLRQLDNLVGVFGASALDSVTPSDVAEYRRIRSAKAATQANRELALLSKLWNWAREHGYTTQPNPCQGVSRNRELGRDVYMSDAVYSAILLAGDQSVKDAMRIGRLTGADIERAQATLGHKQIATTQRHYIRRGKLVDPAK